MSWLSRRRCLLLLLLRILQILVSNRDQTETRPKQNGSYPLPSNPFECVRFFVLETLFWMFFRFTPHPSLDVVGGPMNTGGEKSEGHYQSLTHPSLFPHLIPHSQVKGASQFILVRRERTLNPSCMYLKSVRVEKSHKRLQKFFLFFHVFRNLFNVCSIVNNTNTP